MLNPFLSTVPSLLQTPDVRILTRVTIGTTGPPVFVGCVVDTQVFRDLLQSPSSPLLCLYSFGFCHPKGSLYIVSCTPRGAPQGPWLVRDERRRVEH